MLIYLSTTGPSDTHRRQGLELAKRLQLPEPKPSAAERSWKRLARRLWRLGGWISPGEGAGRAVFLGVGVLKLQ